MPVEHRTLRESESIELEMTEAEARALASVGRRLAGQQQWWGASVPAPERQSSAIAVRATTRRGRWHVRVNDAVGTISVGDLHLTVRPKIPEPHLLGLLTRGGAVPRIDQAFAAHASGHDLWEILATWYLSVAESVIRADLIRDYRAQKDERPYVSGRVDFVRSAVILGRGRLAIAGEVQEYDYDNPLNRVLLAALRLVQTSSLLTHEVRRRANRAASRFDGVSALRPGDLQTVSTERRTSHYGPALALARRLLAGTALGLGHGDAKAWAFLVRTPEPVEEGLRQLLQAALSDHIVEKRGMRLVGSQKRLNPDLVFDRGVAVGDVKYKVHNGSWSNDDLYQLVAFATGFGARRALLVSFSPTGATLQRLLVGDVEVSSAAWNSSPTRTFDESAVEWVSAVERWLVTAPAPHDAVRV